MLVGRRQWKVANLHGTVCGCVCWCWCYLPKYLFPSAGYLVCFVRDCANCVQTDLKALQKKACQHDVTVVILTPGNSRNTLSKAIAHIPVVVDKDGILSKSLNAAWDGRTYLFSSQGRLLWLQKQWGVGYQPAEDTTLVRCLQRLGGKR